MSRADPRLLRELKLYRPYPDAVPWTLFESAGLSEAEHDTLNAWVNDALADPPLMHLRVARQAEETVAAYLLEQEPDHVFVLRFLFVGEGWRRRGIGRWVTGHALGLAESKGGRWLDATPCPATRRFLTAYGFETSDQGRLRYPFQPE